MDKKSLINQEVVNMKGEHGLITDVDDEGHIHVSFDDREASFLADAFEKGYLSFASASVNRKVKVDNINDFIKETDMKIQDAMTELYQLTGLNAVKSQINDLVAHTKISLLRSAFDLKVAETSNHMVFVGNPGTGKTTVARIIAKIFKAMGLLTRGHLVEVDRSQLVAAYQGQTAMKTKKVLESALGGVLLIDEAYSLHHSDQDEYGVEAIDIITKFMEDHRSNLIIIVAGYKSEMKDFIATNPGLASRFKTVINFEDYDSEELYEILDKLFLINDYRLNEEAKLAVHEYLNDHNVNYDNARGMRNIFEKTIVRQARRLNTKEGIEKSDLVTIVKTDLVLEG